MEKFGGNSPEYLNILLFGIVLYICYVTLIYSRNTFQLHHITGIHLHLIYILDISSDVKLWRAKMKRSRFLIVVVG
jgi:hypothetical protein